MSDEEWGGLGDDGYDIHAFKPGRFDPDICRICGEGEDNLEHG